MLPLTANHRRAVGAVRPGAGSVRPPPPVGRQRMGKRLSLSTAGPPALAGS